MAQVRKDFLLERYAVISEKRSARPHDFKSKPISGTPSIPVSAASVAPPVPAATAAPIIPAAPITGKYDPKCFFCPGNEALTPPTIDQYPAKGLWNIRVFLNKFAALKPPLGQHEVIVDVKDHGKDLRELAPEQIVQVFKMYEKRRVALERKYKHVAIFKNVGKEGGASLSHSHTQLLASQFLPPIINQETEASKKHYQKWHRCAWCDEMKKAGRRIALETKYTILIAANAPRFNDEVWVLPKRHVGNFSELKPEEALDFCRVLKGALEKVATLKDPATYNYAVHHAQKGAKFFHFHVEVMPRVAIHAGYELGEGAYIVSVSPETAAKFYRSK